MLSFLRKYNKIGVQKQGKTASEAPSPQYFLINQWRGGKVLFIIFIYSTFTP
jgi:hypothetical protein